MKTAGEFLDALSQELAVGRNHCSTQENFNIDYENESVMNLNMAVLNLIETFVNKVYFDKKMGED